MKFLYTSLLKLLILAPAVGQVGVNLAYHANNADGWEIVDLLSSNSETYDLLGSGPSFGIDYWFRLPNQRIEFTPELNYSRYDTYGQSPSQLERNGSAYSFFLNTNFYLLDFVSDCNCPTFSKQDDLLEKGFFLQISPGFTHFLQEISTNSSSIKTKADAFSLAAALGLDIGLSNLFTITPTVGYRYFLESPVKDTSSVVEPTDQPLLLTKTTASINQLFVKIRLGIRFDKRNY